MPLALYSVANQNEIKMKSVNVRTDPFKKHKNSYPNAFTK